MCSLLSNIKSLWEFVDKKRHHLGVQNSALGYQVIYSTYSLNKYVGRKT